MDDPIYTWQHINTSRLDCKDGQHNSLQQPSQDIVQEYVDQAQIQRAACFWTFFI